MTSALPRIKNDFYPTERALTLGLKKRLPISGWVFEPCAGDGAIAQCFKPSLTNDIDRRHECDYHGDATQEAQWQRVIEAHSIDWVVTNPPFNQAKRILENAWKYSGVGVAFLLRLSFQEPCETKKADFRGEWLEEHADHMSHQIVFSPRPRFREDTRGSDSATVAWFVWQKDFSWKKLGLTCPFQYVRGWR